MHGPKPVLFLALTALVGFGVGVAFAAGDDPPRPSVTEAGGGGEDGAAARYYGPECGAEIPGGTHGDYVSRTAEDGGDVPTMARSSCGKPLKSGRDKEKDKSDKG